MRLGAKQELFARLQPRLHDRAHELGFEIRMGEVLRFEQQARWNATHCRRCKKLKVHRDHPTKHRFRAIGIVRSLHRLKLAEDMVLFKNGKPCWDTESYRELGEWWESLSHLQGKRRRALGIPLGVKFECCWGGRFNDGGHFSIGHGGRK